MRPDQMLFDYTREERDVTRPPAEAVSSARFQVGASHGAYG